MHSFITAIHGKKIKIKNKKSSSLNKQQLEIISLLCLTSKTQKALSKGPENYHKKKKKQLIPPVKLVSCCSCSWNRCSIYFVNYESKVKRQSPPAHMEDFCLQILLHYWTASLKSDALRIMGRSQQESEQCHSYKKEGKKIYKSRTWESRQNVENSFSLSTANK